AGDINGDGQDDIYIITPKGMQVIFSLSCPPSS
ncbi:MAG: FG-GAP repeat protein, partial [Desulfamplus sp.]|nr:FG-GAP repeat protein [Desulfamplus sp.]